MTSKPVSYRAMVRQKPLSFFRKGRDEDVCPSCGEVEQDPEYDSICGLCGFKK